MRSPLFHAPFGDRAGWCLAAAALLFLLAFLRAPAVLAQAPSGPYSATVALDATAKNAVEARQKARRDGERRALKKVVEGLSGPSGATAVSSLGDSAIGAMVVSYSVADERMSSDRYRALYTYHFDPKAVRRLMASAGLVAASPGSATAVVLPVYRDGARLVLWSDPNRWRDAWSRLSLPAGPVSLRVPLGGIGDLAAIDAEKAIAGDPDALSAIAQQKGAEVAIVALATAERSDQGVEGFEVSLKRYREGTLSGSLEANFKPEPGESASDLMSRMAQASIQPIESGFGAASATPVSAEGPASSLAAVVPLRGLRDWVAVRARLEGLPAVRGLELLSLSRHRAEIRIRFAGSEEALRASLAAGGLTLPGGGPLWRIEPAGAR